MFYIFVTKYFTFLLSSFVINFSRSVSFVNDFIEMFPYLFMYSTNAIIIIFTVLSGLCSGVYPLSLIIL